FVRHFLFYKIQCCSIYLNKISFKFTDKAPIFADLSVSKTHFTDKAGFLERLSVKLGSKLPKSYGQTAIFAHFVRNLHFSSSPFTDKISIFIDVSVNDSDFVKCSVC
ncbi:hypothetical protein, partial [Ligilactobacillus ruminis]|uniref:hypothetical protein n=1 Tax=Ligilactobacillus ruminis TaxID=1623 RepID=UPI0002265F3F